MTRYSVVLWGYPPHRAEMILPQVISSLAQLSKGPLDWFFEDEPNRPLPASQDEWGALASEYQKHSSFGALHISLISPSGLSISFNADAPAFVRDFDVLSVGLNTEHLTGLQAMLSFDRLYALFQKSIGLFRPFWGEVCDHELTRTDKIDALRFSVDRTQVPDTIHWFNFFGKGMVDRLGGKEKLLSAPAYEIREWEDPPGMLLILQREPFDFHNPEHRQKHEKIVQCLELKCLHALYPRKREVHLADRSLSDS